MKILPNNKLQQYVRNNCSREYEEVKNRRLGDINYILTIEEQTLIYKYTEDGYETLNQRLRISEGKDFSEFGKLLNKTMSKLPDYQDVVYRAADMTNHELKKYIDANENNSILVEHSFISASKSKFIAYQFGKSCLFQISSKNGKDIEAFAKYGTNYPPNEKEVLFKPNTRFRALRITNDKNYTLITLEEVDK